MIASSELIINPDGSIFHLHIKPEELADTVILVGDPGRVEMVASFFETREAEAESREFRFVTGTYRGKRITNSAKISALPQNRIQLFLNIRSSLPRCKKYSDHRLPASIYFFRFITTFMPNFLLMYQRIAGQIAVA